MASELSFSSELFTAFDVVVQHDTQRRKDGEEFLQLLRERASYEEAYARGLERIGNNTYFVATQGTLSQAICAMKNDSLNKAMQAKILADNINHDLVTPFRELLKEQAAAAKTPVAEGKRLEKQRASLVERLDKAKIRYWKACRECELATVAMDSARNDHRRVRIIDRLMETRREVDASLKHYQEALKHHNEIADGFNTNMKSILDLLQQHEEERLSILKDSLQKLVIYETSCLRNLQYDIDNLAHSMERINIQGDIAKFIQDTAKTKPNRKVTQEEFIPFEGSHPSFKQIGTNPPLITIPIPIPEQTPPTLSVSQLLDKAWTGTELESTDYSSFNTLMKDPAARRLVVDELLKKKTQKETVLDQVGFKQVGELLIALLNECERVGDWSPVQTVVELSQVIQKRTTDSDGEPMQRLIAPHSLWSKLELWDRIIQTSIDHELTEQAEYGVPESKEEAVSRKKNAVFVRLGAHAQTMISFRVQPTYAAEMISKYACKYELPSQDIDILMATVDKSFAVKIPEEVVTEVQRGVPAWLQELEGAASAISRRNQPKKRLSEQLLKTSQDKSDTTGRRSQGDHASYDPAQVIHEVNEEEGKADEDQTEEAKRGEEKNEDGKTEEGQGTNEDKKIDEDRDQDDKEDDEGLQSVESSDKPEDGREDIEELQDD